MIISIHLNFPFQNDFIGLNLIILGSETREELEIQKLMFTRSKELEQIIKFQRETIQDQTMRIEVCTMIYYLLFKLY